MRPILRQTLGAAVLAIAFGACLTAAYAEKRVALVIGNSAYRNTLALPNPVNDATDVAGALTALGLETLPETKLHKPRLDDAFPRLPPPPRGAGAPPVLPRGPRPQYSGLNQPLPGGAPA